MKMRTVSVCLRWASLCGLLLCASCHSKEEPANSHKTTTEAADSDQARALLEELRENLRSAPSDSKDAKAASARAWDRLRAQIELHEPQEVKRLAVLLSSIDNFDDSERAIHGAVIVYLVEHGEREALVALLAAKCPARIGGGLDIELCLALLGKDALPDAIVVLCDAFDASTSPSAKGQVVAALRRAFGGAVELPSDDASVVTSCRKWYGDHRARLTVNMEYGNNALRGEDMYLKEPLFIEGHE